MTRNYKRLTNDMALRSAYLQGHADALLGLPRLNPYNQRNYLSAYDAGYLDALVETHYKTKLENNAQT